MDAHVTAMRAEQARYRMVVENIWLMDGTRKSYVSYPRCGGYVTPAAGQRELLFRNQHKPAVPTKDNGIMLHIPGCMQFVYFKEVRDHD